MTTRGHPRAPGSRSGDLTRRRSTAVGGRAGRAGPAGPTGQAGRAGQAGPAIPALAAYEPVAPGVTSVLGAGGMAPGISNLITPRAEPRAGRTMDSPADRQTAPVASEADGIVIGKLRRAHVQRQPDNYAEIHPQTVAGTGSAGSRGGGSAEAAISVHAKLAARAQRQNRSGGGVCLLAAQRRSSRSRGPRPALRTRGAGRAGQRHPAGANPTESRHRDYSPCSQRSVTGRPNAGWDHGGGEDRHSWCREVVHRPLAWGRRQDQP